MYPDESDPYLVSAREIRSFHNFDFPHLGILMIRFDIEKIVRNVARGAEKNRGDILILADNRVMFPTESLDNGDPAIWAPAPGERYVIREIDGEKLFITRHVSPESGWTYLNVIPFDRIFEKTTMMKKVVMAFILVIFVSVIALGMRFARGITRPIEDLISKMRHVQQGDFDKAEAESASLSRQYMDETGLLHRNFRIMVQRINELIRENYLKQIMIKETEFRALPGPNQSAFPVQYAGIDQLDGQGEPPAGNIPNGGVAGLSPEPGNHGQGASCLAR